jgi:hypothetical protein
VDEQYYPLVDIYIYKIGIDANFIVPCHYWWHTITNFYYFYKFLLLQRSHNVLPCMPLITHLCVSV